MTAVKVDFTAHTGKDPDGVIAFQLNGSAVDNHFRIIRAYPGSACRFGAAGGGSVVGGNHLPVVSNRAVAQRQQANRACPGNINRAVVFNNILNTVRA